ncbi:hypothetical protein [Candidatus Ventrimonas sp.]|uniref:hypothetical protein n=1 Tax=Candidatus Ventrimonas sp. TaxID=3048889 RepID=UPI003AB417F3
MARIVTAAFSSGCRFTQAQGSLWQYDYGTVLHLKGLELPAAVEIHFATVERGGESETRIGITADGVTEVKIPDALLEMAKTQDYNLYAFVYLDDGKSGQTEYKILMTVRARPKPGEEHPDTEKDHPLADAVRAVNAAADRAETAAGNAAESKAAAEDAAEQADKSRVAAETVAKHVDEAGRTALTGIASAKTDAAETIETAKTGAVKAVDAARETAIKAVADARTAAEQSLSEAEIDGVAAIETAKTEGLQAIDKAKSDIETARSGAIKDIDAAKTSGVQAVEAVTAGIEQTKTAAVQAVEAAENEGVAAVNAAVEAGKTNFVTDESLTLSGRAADAKVVGDELAKKADQTELEDVKKRQNILVGSETGSRVYVTDAFESPLEGLVLYGKSTQVTTTGAQLLDLQNMPLKTSTGAKISRLDDGGFIINGTPAAEYEQYISAEISLSAGTYYISGGENKNSGAYAQISIKKANGSIDYVINRSFTIDGTENRLVFAVQIGSYTAAINNYQIYPMLNAGDAPLPWEPYTGSKPSPSPDYPQEIQSAKSEVVVYGKNLFGGRFYYARYSYGILFIENRQKNEEVKFPYQPVTEASGICKALKCRKGKTYIISVTNPNKNAAVGVTEYETIEKAIDINNALGFVNIGYNTLKKTYIAKSDGILVCGIAGTWTNGKTTLHECTESELLQVEEASEATTYEPYRPAQIFTITSPTSLPGIPVPSGGNYTDETGQQWICDEVDLERGVYVQRIYTVDIAELEYSAGTILQTVKRIFYKISVPSTGVTNKGYCTRLTYSANYSADNPHFYINEERIVVFIPLDTTIKPKEYLVQYVLATPIETPLSETDIAAYRALTTYSPTTIVETDGARMKLDYQRDVNIVIKQLTDTIASMTN